MVNKNWSKDLEVIHKLEARYGSMNNVPKSKLTKLHKMPGIKDVLGDYTEITHTQYNAIKLVMDGKQGKAKTSRELKRSNSWLDKRIHAIDENKYYITENE
ncbi:hypothetical protein [Lactiplantibacillus plantarum]|uniref:hypothetical protein n=1 Tax=Lactiplantibacillus plantarum TaxID=1590 RepID=UPI00077E0AF3|nr:hypothetical protein [Lactiplantibacillus plantarum]AVE82327.1 hypothetical protein C4O30_04685 [Lactiplantibacillus plantarum]AXH04300.1 hypothetical protein CEB41_07390 [Lactiplantibacillus plantarum]KYK05494.1 hypothetical protein Lpl43_05920 [Lactiplantibacillus plantarum]KYK53243.1 hypothetical protein AYO51_08020 [Lactiplantibacillus plantarum]KYM70545.1 hypothetical protein AZJ01_03760 [Lactiplantibacillus plantarum]